MFPKKCNVVERSLTLGSDFFSADVFGSQGGCQRPGFFESFRCDIGRIPSPFLPCQGMLFESRT